jgi:hypothetical protein
VSAFEKLMKYAYVAKTTQLLINFNLARLYLRLGETDKAKEALRLAREGNHPVIDKRIMLAEDLKPIAPGDLTSESTKENVLLSME